MELCEPFEFGDDPTALYRLYGDDDVLLYVGITHSPASRMSAHAVTQPWWPEVTRKTMVWYSDRTEAAKVEQTAIRAESPRHNTMLTTSSASARLGRGQLTDRLRQEFLAEMDQAYEAGEWTPTPGGGRKIRLTPENRARLSYH